MNIIEDAELDQLALRALKRRGTASRRVQVDQEAQRGRKALRFPRLTNRYDSKFSKTYYRAVEEHLELWEVRILNDVWLAGFERPTEEQLAGIFEWHIRDHVNPGVRTGLKERDICRLSEKRAHRALQGWTPDYISKMKALGKIGGKKSKRVSPHLDWLRDHQDVGASEAAEKLGICRQQVYKLRAQIALKVAPSGVSPVRDMNTNRWELERPAEYYVDSLWDPEDEPMPFRETTRVDLFENEAVPMEELEIQAEDEPVLEGWCSVFNAEEALAADRAAGEAAFAESFPQLLLDLGIVSAPSELPSSSSDWGADIDEMDGCLDVGLTAALVPG